MSFSEKISLLSLSIALVTIVSNFIVVIIGKQYDKKIKVLEIVLASAFKEYEYRTNIELANAKTEERNPKVLSFTEYIIFYTKLSEVLVKHKLSAEDIRQALEENKIIIDSYYDNREVYRPHYHKSDV